MTVRVRCDAVSCARTDNHEFHVGATAQLWIYCGLTGNKDSAELDRPRRSRARIYG